MILRYERGISARFDLRPETSKNAATTLHLAAHPKLPAPFISYCVGRHGLFLEALFKHGSSRPANHPSTRFRHRRPAATSCKRGPSPLLIARSVQAHPR